MINYAHWFSKEDARDFAVEEKIANREDLSEEDRKYKVVKFKKYEVQKHLPFLDRIFHLHGDDVPEGLSGAEYIIASFPFDAGGKLKDEWDIETCILAFNEGWIDGFIVKRPYDGQFQLASPTASYYGIILIDPEKRQLLHDTVKEKFEMWLNWFDKTDLRFGIKKHTWASNSIRGICSSETWDEHMKECEKTIRDSVNKKEEDKDADTKKEDEENLPFEKRVENLAFITWYDDVDIWNIWGQKIGAHQSYETIDMAMQIVNRLKDCGKYYHEFEDNGVYWYPFIVNHELRDSIENYLIHQEQKAKIEKESKRIEDIAESLI